MRRLCARLPATALSRLGAGWHESRVHWLIVLLHSSASSAIRNLQAAVCRRRFLTIELALHVLSDLLHYTLHDPSRRTCDSGAQ